MATSKNLSAGGASGVLYTDRRDFYIDPQVTKELWTDVSPFTINKGTPGDLPDNDVGLGSLPIDNVVGLAALETSNSSYIGLVVEVWSSDGGTKRGTAVVTAVSATPELTLKSLSGAYTIVDNDVCRVIGNAHGEGSSAPNAWADELSVVWNSCQIFKTPLQITGTLLQASLRGESSELARLRLQKSQEHKMQKEKAFLFGQRIGGTGLDLQDGSTSDSFADGGRTDGDGNLIRTSYGIIPAIEAYGSSTSTHDYQNIFTVDDSYAYGNFVDDMEKVFQYVPEVGVKRAFCGAGAMGYWSKLAGTSGMAGNSGWTVNLSDMKRDSLGFNYKILETPHRILQLIHAPALRGQYNKYMLVVDDSNMFHAQYRSQMYQTNIKTDNAFDGVKDQYFSDEGLGISLIESHNLFKITV